MIIPVEVPHMDVSISFLLFILNSPHTRAADPRRSQSANPPVSVFEGTAVTGH